MKRLVVCLDGTWNNTSREVQKNESKVYRPTNVLKIARAVSNKSQEGIQQITHYDAGVGSMNRAPDWQARVLKKVDNVLGGGWGTGFEINIEEAYTFLANNYEAGDEIFVFGFSRGAAQARSLCQLIAWAGGFPPKRDAYYVPTIFSEYLRQRGEHDASALIAEINGRREKRGDDARVTIVPAEVTFLGVWDTVLALGWRTKARYSSSDYKLAFHTSATPPAKIKTVRHALAIDEQRHDFQPEIWEPGPSLEQRWFAGAHSNVGGGLIDDSLANISLKWMAAEAQLAGLAVDLDYLKYYNPYPLGNLQAKSLKYQLIDKSLWLIRGNRGVREIPIEGTTLDPSVFERLNPSKAIPKENGGHYRPDNLFKYLAANKQYDDRLSKDVLEAVQKLR